MATFSAVTDSVRVEAPRAQHRAASFVLMALFFAIGFLTCLNDIIIPHFKSIFDLDYTRDRAPGVVFTDVKDVKAKK